MKPGFTKGSTSLL